MNIKTIKSTGLMLLANAVFLVSATAPAIAANSNIVPPTTKFQGYTYSKLAEKWFKYAYSLPFGHHPITDTANCSAGQSGNIWFFRGGGFGDKQYPKAGRNCTIPPNTAVFLALQTVSWDNEACDTAHPNVIHKTNFTTKQLRDNAYNDLIDGVGFLKILIDDKNTTRLGKPCNPKKPASCQTPYLIRTPVFDYTVPAQNNSLKFFNGVCYTNPNKGHPYKVPGAVGIGYFALIKPLPLGNHTLRFGWNLSAGGKPLLLYHLKVSQ